MKVSLVWSSPYPERTIAVAMRRCYSTKTIEEIESELEQKGTDYWRYLLTKALQDKSLDVFEHFTLTLLVEGVGDAEMGALVRDFPYLRATRVKDTDWFVSMNARTLVELWRGRTGDGFVELVLSELASKSVCPIFSEVAFGGETHAS